jgi:hypothetical protein
MNNSNELRMLIIGRQEKPGNYISALLDEITRNPPKPGTLNKITIAHDTYCDFLIGGGACNCEPEVEVKGI